MKEDEPEEEGLTEALRVTATAETEPRKLVPVDVIVTVETIVTVADPPVAVKEARVDSEDTALAVNVTSIERVTE